MPNRVSEGQSRDDFAVHGHHSLIKPKARITSRTTLCSPEYVRSDRYSELFEGKLSETFSRKAGLPEHLLRYSRCKNGA